MNDDWTILREDWLIQGGFLERLVVLTYRLRHWGLTRRHAAWRLLAALLLPWEAVLRVLYSGQISARCHIGRRFRLTHAWGVVIHSSAVLGDGCTMYHQVTIGINEHRSAREGPRLGEYVYLGAGAKVIGAVTVGDRAVVGANAVVVHDVPPDHLAVGAPARCTPRRDRSME